MRLELEGVGRLVQRDPGPERADRHAQRAGRRANVLLDEQEPAGRRLHGQQGQVVLAEDPRAHEAEQEAELAVRHPAIGERHRRLGQAATRRDHLVEQVGFELADQRRERADVGADPAGPIDHGRALDDARQRRAQGARERRDDPGHRVGVGGLGGAQLGRVQGAGGAGQPAHGDPLDLRPVDQPAPRRPLGVAPDHGRRGAERRADQEARLPDAVVAPRQATVRVAGSRARRLIAPRPRARPARRPGRPSRTTGWPGRGTGRDRRS